MTNTAVKTETANLSLVVNNDKPFTVTTLQIAELTGKEHKHVRRDFKEMVESILKGSKLVGGDQSKTGLIGYYDEIYFNDSQNRKQPMYEMDEELCMTLITGYDAPLRYKVNVEIKRLKEENAELKTDKINKEIKEQEQTNPYLNKTKLDWMREATALEEANVKLQEEKEQLVALHVRKSIDAHSMTRLLGEKRGSTKVQEALTALREAGYIERRLNEEGKPCGYDLLESGYGFCRVSAHGQLEFTVDVLPVLVKLGVLEEEKKETLKLPQPNIIRADMEAATKKIRKTKNENTFSLVAFGI
ncbi:hypothetical protein A4L30_10665 [Salmonella enterica subsp. enterica serovar Bovismorbificans]|nr:hypothetical protein [Salmonella enterica subsp. enterica serovar Bovismorbificans]